MSENQSPRPGNRLLDALPADSRDRFFAAASYVDLPLGTQLFRREEPVRSLYFLTVGIASTVFISEGGTSIELATQGFEGLVGTQYLLGPELSQGDCTIQVSASGYRVPLSVMQREFHDSHEARTRVLEYAQHQMIFANQVVACNRLHRAEARFARWLLGILDRLPGPEISMTQEFMSTMLGTRRTTVAEVCSDLAREGALESRRGGVRIVDRKQLERRACECYPILRAHFDRLYGRPVPAIPGHAGHVGHVQAATAGSRR